MDISITIIADIFIHLKMSLGYFKEDIAISNKVREQMMLSFNVRLTATFWWYLGSSGDSNKRPDANNCATPAPISMRYF